MTTGQILRVEATDPAAPKDFRAFAQAVGADLKELGEEDGAFVFEIEKSG